MDEAELLEFYSWPVSSNSVCECSLLPMVDIQLVDLLLQAMHNWRVKHMVRDVTGFHVDQAKRNGWPVRGQRFLPDWALTKLKNHFGKHSFYNVLASFFKERMARSRFELVLHMATD